VTTEARGASGAFGQGRASLFSTTAAGSSGDARLHDEIFGAASLLVRCPDLASMTAIVEGLEGQLTAALHIDEGDFADARSVFPVLERRVGRILVNGFGTGVEVGHAMVHGGHFRRRPMAAPHRSVAWRSFVSCARSAIRTCRTPSCRKRWSRPIHLRYSDASTANYQFRRSENRVKACDTMIMRIDSI
jgi:hypothetical protein